MLKSMFSKNMCKLYLFRLEKDCISYYTYLIFITYKAYFQRIDLIKKS